MPKGRGLQKAETLLGNSRPEQVGTLVPELYAINCGYETKRVLTENTSYHPVKWSYLFSWFSQGEIKTSLRLLRTVCQEKPISSIHSPINLNVLAKSKLKLTVCKITFLTRHNLLISSKKSSRNTLFQEKPNHNIYLEHSLFTGFTRENCNSLLYENLVTDESSL